MYISSKYLYQTICFLKSEYINIIKDKWFNAAIKNLVDMRWFLAQIEQSVRLRRQTFSSIYRAGVIRIGRNFWHDISDVRGDFIGVSRR